jgi:isopropylmalate/homocitrate/citramalate synthase
VESRSVAIVEVGPRDGLQNERLLVAADTKVAFVDALSESGLPAIEVTSFVSPAMIPQLADGDEVFRRAAKRSGVRYPVLVPNLRGLERALGAGVREIAVFTAASDTFNKRNTNVTIDESFERFRPVLAKARREGVAVRAYVSCVFGCPYEGSVPPSKGAEVAARLRAEGCDEISLADTIGIAVPSQVPEVVERSVAAGVPLESMAFHFHDTRGTALANVVEALRCGVRTFDSSAGGFGGCPYAPGAAGNLATEDLVYLLHGMGYQTGVDLRRIVGATAIVAATLDKAPPSRAWHAVTAAGRTPPDPIDPPACPI